MPLPLIPIIGGIVAATTAGVGIKKGIDAKSDMDLAKSINQDAQSIANKAEESIKRTKEYTTNTLEYLGRKKIDILSGSIKDFVTAFEQIKNIDFQESEGLDELKNFNPQSPEFIQLKKVSMEAAEITVNGLGALGSGALLAFGTYNVVMGGLGGLLVTATTGTALSTLSGVAATNATLAWLGGGALAAGGFGMAGGMAVLGGLVAGPALAVGGSLLAKQADKAYWDAHSNREKAKVFSEQAEGICSTLRAINKRAANMQELLSKLNQLFIKSISEMQSVINRSGIDWRSYTDGDKRRIYKCVQLAQVIKMILDTSLLSESGELLPESKNALQEGQKFLNALA